MSSILLTVLKFGVCVLYLLIYQPKDTYAKVIHGRYTENIEHYQLAVPHKATVDGEFSTFHLPHFHELDPTLFKKRKKRELNDPDIVHYGVLIDDQLHHIDLWPNRDFVHPQMVVEKRDPNLPVHKREVNGLRGQKMCYYTGKVRGFDNSGAAITTCDGLTGVINIGHKRYFIEPVHQHSPNAEGHHLHVVYEKHPKDTSKFCGVDTSGTHWDDAFRERLRQDYLGEKLLYKREEKEQGGFEIKPQWMAMMVVCDKGMVLKHKGHRDITQWVLAVFNIVKYLYADESYPGINQPVVVRIILLEKQEDEIDLAIGQQAPATLNNFCKWAVKLQAPNTSVHHFDTVLLLSNLDFCAGDNCGAVGLAHVGQGCGKYPCQINEDCGVLTGYVVAHEQGHLLGMNHDGESPQSCPMNDTDGTWFIMAMAGDQPTVRWSPCTIAEMRALTTNHFLDCFYDEPLSHEYILPEGLPGVLYDVNEQCRMKYRFDNISGSCEKGPVKDCTEIWCKDASINRCFARHPSEAADGTPCGQEGDEKWCFQMKCVEKASRPKAVDGGWGEWTDWDPCSRTCGKGIKKKRRFCDSPKPANKGKYCAGSEVQYKVCKEKDCPDDAISFRAQQCLDKIEAKFPYVKKEDFVDIQLPEEGESPCELNCLFKNPKHNYTKESFTVAKAADPGTLCKAGTSNVCVAGQCVEVGCDGNFDSIAVEDRCGICNGDGTMCNVVEGEWTSKGLEREKLPKLGEIPAGARKIEIVEKEPHKDAICIGNSDKSTFYVNGNRVYPGGAYACGSKKNMLAYYSGYKAPVEKFILERCKEDLGVFLGIYDLKEAKYHYKWVMPSDDPTYEPKYSWDTDEFEPCSALCGGGTQMPKYHCVEEKAGKVSEKFCEKVTKPPGEPKKCNEKACGTEWKVGEWGPCRACKTKGGVRIRAVQCTKKNPKPGADDIIQEDTECPAPKPGTVELCETNKKCGSRKRKSPAIPGKFQNTIYQQMKKLHIVKRKEATNKDTTMSLLEKETEKTFARTDSSTITTSTIPTLTPYHGTSFVLPDKDTEKVNIDFDKEVSEKIYMDFEVQHLGNISAEEEKKGVQSVTRLVPGTTRIVKDYQKILNKKIKLQRCQKQLNRSKQLKASTKKPHKRFFSEITLPGQENNENSLDT